LLERELGRELRLVLRPGRPRPGDWSAKRAHNRERGEDGASPSPRKPSPRASPVAGVA